MNVRRLKRRISLKLGALAEIGSSLGSALSGNPSSLDERNLALWNRILHGRNYHGITPFSIDVTQADQTPYKTLWVKSGNGAYCVLRTQAPFRHRRKVTLEPAYVLLYSPDPTILGRLFLYPGERPDEEVIKHNVHVISARYERDILPAEGAGRDDAMMNFSWARDAIELHDSVYDSNLRAHGILTRDGKTLWRSGSSLIWASPTEGGYNVHYYCNPRYGRQSLFLSERVLENWMMRHFLNSFAIQWNDKPVPESEVREYVRKTFARYVRKQLYGADPYLVDMPKSIWGWSVRYTKTSTLRFLQQCANFVQNLSWSTALKSAAFTGVTTLALYLLGQGMLVLGLLASAPAAAMRDNAIFKAVTASARRLSQAVTQRSDIRSHRHIEIASLFCDESAIDYRGDVQVFPLSPKYIPYMDPIPLSFMAGTYKQTVPFQPSEERDWANSLILDTFGCHPGTVFEETPSHEHIFLTAIQPDGMDVDYLPERDFAYACRRREPDNGHCLERPLQNLFDSLPAGKKYYAVKHVGDGKLVTRAFAGEKDFPISLLYKKVGKNEDVVPFVRSQAVHLHQVAQGDALTHVRRRTLAALKPHFRTANLERRLGTVEDAVRKEMVLLHTGHVHVHNGGSSTTSHTFSTAGYRTRLRPQMP